MALQDELFEIEQGFWLEGEDFFLAHVNEQCLLAFPQMDEFHGVFPRERVAATATHENRWSGLNMKDRSLLEPNRDTAIISYRAEVKRADGKPYVALVSSAYCRRDDGWKLAFHQHSPL